MFVKALPYIILAAAVAGALWLADSKGYERGKLYAEGVCTNTTVPAARSEEKLACKKNENVTVETCDVLQNRLNASTARYVGLLRQLDAARTVQPAGDAGGDDGAAARKLLPVQAGEIAGDILDLGYTADRQTGQLVACQHWVAEVKRLNPGVTVDAK